MTIIEELPDKDVGSVTVEISGPVPAGACGGIVIELPAGAYSQVNLGEKAGPDLLHFLLDRVPLAADDQYVRVGFYRFLDGVFQRGAMGATGNQD
jgi:hypothetical protein